MRLPQFDISKEKMDINAKFYFFLKYLVKADLNDNQVLKIVEYYQLFFKKITLDEFKQLVLEQFSVKTKKGNKQIEYFNEIFIEIQDNNHLELFIFSVKLMLIKDLLLQEAKIKLADNIEKLKNIYPLSLEYDKITVLNPYHTRVNGALLSLLFFENLKVGFSQDTNVFIENLVTQSNDLMKIGIEPNQIFMLLFNESLNQSITSDSGLDYENRIKSVLLGLGILAKDINKTHDKVDKSTEFDLFFVLNGKTFGIGAKRTLRERYKQFIKTAQMTPVDVMIEITLGTDLTFDKVKAIVNHGIYLFVADEIYQQEAYLQNIDKVYSCKDLTLETLHALYAR
ncbi:hypothetical protein MOMA_06641 [Moraxella macacae 0408225]|uniref:Restriction endonuclease type II EcoRII C-terminal domain-containing protein n=1 Tax=Moraxella macacae 0408225 TaxID=1230338 RepID=L2F6Z4_9GAMM|nr:hypothetical protein [Moraxella macacae]ELA08218.1 hypothetical protein MOMA_06641 [Moraxella macacae 0408225]